MPLFDVVTVPDFSGRNARRFEMLTLFFLASWIEYAGKSNRPPLHIAAIGEAPDSVRILADRCGAEITVHQPLLFGGAANKQRGFEVNHQTGHILLIDTDVFIFSDISKLPERIGRDCIAAAVDGCLPTITNEEWARIYRGLKIDAPKISLPPLDVVLDTFKFNSDPPDQFFPYFNAGVVYAPWESGLSEVWRENLERLSLLSIPLSKPSLTYSDQPAFAASIVQLEGQGTAFQLLPDEYHVRWQHLTTGAVRFKNTKLLHALNFCRQKLDLQTCSPADAVNTYLEVMLALTRKVKFHKVNQSSKLSRALYHLKQRPRRKDVYRMHAAMKSLSDKYVSQLMS